MNKEFVQGSTEWLERRRRSITATDVAAILGKSKYDTPYSLWRKKRGLDDVIVTPAMRFGTNNEPYARARYADATGHRVEPLVVVHPEFDWIMASLDGVTFDRSHACEIKSITTSNKFNEPIPEEHKIQMEMQAQCLGITSIDYVRDDGFQQKWQVYHCDPDFLERHFDKIYKFYCDVINEHQPPFVEKDVPVRLDFDWCSSMSQYFHHEKLMKEHKRAMDAIKEDLITLSRGQSYKGGGGQLLKISRKGNIDYGKIEALQDIDLEEYRSPDIEYWSLKKDGTTA